VKPEATTEIIPATKPNAAPTDTVRLDTIDYDDAGNIQFAGRSAPGASIRIYIDDATIADLKADGEGKWSLTNAPKVAAGNRILRADVINEKNEVVNRIEVPFLREEPERVTTLQQAGTVSSSRPDRIVIQPGNNLWRISRVIYGKGKRYTLIFEANRDQIANPNKIYPGQIFAAPKP
jgi:nucleoid-associated protein YgaU